MRIVYVGLDLFLPALETFLSENITVDKIYTCPVDNIYEFNTEIIKTAASHGIPCTLEPITARDVLSMRDSGTDFLICGGYYHRIPTVEDFPMINMHPALLPDGRGSWPMPETIMRRYKRSGVTFHKMVDSFDEGDIILQRSFDLSANENLESFTCKFQSLLPDMIRELIEEFEKLWKGARPQGKGEYYRLPDERDCTVNEFMTPDECDLILRAFFGFECFLETGGKRYSVLRGRYSKENTPGAVPICGGYVAAERICEICEIK